MTETIKHNGVTYSLDDVKRDLEVISDAVVIHLSNNRYIGTPVYSKPTKASLEKPYKTTGLQYLRFLCCGVEKHVNDEDRPAFRANDVFKKYVKIDLSKKPVYESREYSRANRPYELNSAAFQKKLAEYKDGLLLQMEDLVLAAKNPTLCKIYAVINGSKKEQHIQIVKESQNSGPQQ